MSIDITNLDAAKMLLKEELVELGIDLDALEEEEAAKNPPEKKKGDRPKTNANTEKAPKPADALLGLFLSCGAELFHTPEQVAYARVRLGNHYEVVKVRSKAFRQYLQLMNYSVKNSTVPDGAVSEALGVIEGKALFEGSEHAVYIRSAWYNDKIYIDLCNDKWSVVEVDALGWRIIERSPVYFVRRPGMLPFPDPVQGGNLTDLKDFVNIKEDDWPLFIAFLAQSINPNGPYPMLSLIGNQGAAKTTTSRVTRKLVDPNATPTRTAPRDEHTLMIMASNSRLLVLDNASSVPDWLSDAYCRLATGGGFSTRTLYTDDEEQLFTAMRPIIINGITELATRPDLLDRSIIVNCPEIPEDKRKDEKSFWAEFEIAYPSVFGALLNRVSNAIRNLPHIKRRDLPRMADFAVWAMAAETEEERQERTFITRYRKNRSDASALALDSSFGIVLQSFVEEYHSWQGTATDLFKLLTARVCAPLPLPEGTESSGKEQKPERAPRDWPKDATRLSGLLRRLVTNLRAVGIDVVLGDREGKKRQRIITIKEVGQKADAEADARGQKADAKRPKADAKPLVADANSLVADATDAVLHTYLLGEDEKKTENRVNSAHSSPKSEDAAHIERGCKTASAAVAVSALSLSNHNPCSFCGGPGAMRFGGRWVCAQAECAEAAGIPF